MSARLRTAVLISGRGSNLKALLDACASKDFPAKIVLVISNIAEASGLSYARAAGIPIAILPHKDYSSRKDFDAVMDRRLEEAGAEFICLAGFMRILSDDFVRRWEGKMINIHPSLLPAYKGTHVHERVLEAGEKISGCTVHYVVPELDSGPTILQAEVPVFSTDTPDTLAARVLVEEHRIYPVALKRIAEARVHAANRT